jgi:hypothetical protein
LWAVAFLNAVTWLARIVPAVVHGGAPGYLRGTGLTTNVVYVQDLALWLPLLAVAAAWLWQRRPWGYLLAGAGRRGWLPWSLAVLDGLTGAAAVYGGAELIRDGFGMPDSWLAGTPITGWVLPGVGSSSSVAAPAARWSRTGCGGATPVPFRGL